MRSETIQKITDIWLNCDVGTQTKLIRKFLDQLDSGMSTEWVEFLLDELVLMTFLR